MKKISVLIPVHNEEKNVPLVHAELCAVWARELGGYAREIVFIDDGSQDGTVRAVEALIERDPTVRCIEFSRNFGKEMATTAGLDAAGGDAAVMMDADLQHPPALIPRMVGAWQDGAEVVAAVRAGNTGEGFVKKWGSLAFYRIMGLISDTDFRHGDTDFRLLDRAVVEAYRALPERERMTRSLINWLGFRRENVPFVAPARAHGPAQYSTVKLVRLAVSSLLSHTLLPLRLAGYLGVTISALSGVLGAVILVERYAFNDALNWHVSGSAQLAVLIVFLVGIVLAAQGIIGLYVGSIRTEVAARPLYIVRRTLGQKP
jgi:dolichol-phosphate mannosyltransferase